jgi:hypothetical protein
MEWLWVFAHQYNHRAFNGDYYFIGYFHQCWRIHYGVSKFILRFLPFFPFLFLFSPWARACLITCAANHSMPSQWLSPVTTTTFSPFSPGARLSAGLHLPQTIQPRQCPRLHHVSCLGRVRCICRTADHSAPLLLLHSISVIIQFDPWG